MNYNNWYAFDSGNSVGQLGSESGKVIFDIENSNGARITIEKDAEIAPYAITIGVYGLLFHTHFAGTDSEAQQFTLKTKMRIEKLFEHSMIPKDRHDEIWYEKYNKLMCEICEQE